MCYDYFSASRNGCTALRRIFGGFSNEKGAIFHYLYKDNKIIPRRLEGRYKSFQHFFDRRADSRPFLCVFGTGLPASTACFRPFPPPAARAFAAKITPAPRPHTASGQGHISSPRRGTAPGQIPVSFPRSASSPCGCRGRWPGCWCSARSAPGACAPAAFCGQSPAASARCPCPGRSR